MQRQEETGIRSLVPPGRDPSDEEEEEENDSMSDASILDDDDNTDTRASSSSIGRPVHLTRDADGGVPFSDDDEEIEEEEEDAEGEGGKGNEFPMYESDLESESDGEEEEDEEELRVKISMDIPNFGTDKRTVNAIDLISAAVASSVNEFVESNNGTAPEIDDFVRQSHFELNLHNQVLEEVRILEQASKRAMSRRKVLRKELLKVMINSKRLSSHVRERRARLHNLREQRLGLSSAKAYLEQLAQSCERIATDEDTQEDTQRMRESSDSIPSLCSRISAETAGLFEHVEYANRLLERALDRIREAADTP